MPAFFTAFGLAGAAGLNAYVPLMIIGLLGRFGVVHLAAPYDQITNTWVLVLVGALLLLEVVVDKIPGVDHLNDVVQTFIRPAAGALLFAASTGAMEAPAWLGLTAGLLTAFSVHATKAAARPAVNVTTAGVGAPIVSALEDVLAIVTSLVAILVPYLVAVCLVVIAVALVVLLRRKRRAASRSSIA